MSTRTIARAMTTGRGRSVWAIEAVPAEMTCRVFTSPAWGMNTIGPASAVDGWNGPNSCWTSCLSFACSRCTRACSREWRAGDVGVGSAGGGTDGSLAGGGGCGTGGGSGVGVWARAAAQTSSASATTPITNPTFTADATTPTPNPTLTANPRCTILRRGLACWARLHFPTKQPWRPPGS